MGISGGVKCTVEHTLSILQIYLYAWNHNLISLNKKTTARKDK